MLQKTDLVAYRPLKEEDRNFIYATWLRGLYYDKDGWFREIPKDIFMENYHRAIERVLSSPHINVRVACLKDDADVILGYSVSRKYPEAEVLDWVFVKSAWRGIGVTKGLIPNQIQAVTHLTTPGKAILRKKFPDAIYNPFL